MTPDIFTNCSLFQILLQGLQRLNRAVHQDVVAVELLQREEWVAPSAVVLQDDGAKGEEDEDEEEEEKKVRPYSALQNQSSQAVLLSHLLSYIYHISPLLSPHCMLVL